MYKGGVAKHEGGQRESRDMIKLFPCKLDETNLAGGVCAMLYSEKIFGKRAKMVLLAASYDIVKVKIFMRDMKGARPVQCLPEQVRSTSIGVADEASPNLASVAYRPSEGGVPCAEEVLNASFVD